MNKEKQRIAIAEACGYERLTQHEAVWRHEGSKIYTAGNLPNYLNDLNAMHESEKTLDYDDLNDMEESVSFHFGVTPFHATAAERAEAFLRTIGKWEES
jgi:hypothetical protein